MHDMNIDKLIVLCINFATDAYSYVPIIEMVYVDSLPSGFMLLFINVGHMF